MTFLISAVPKVGAMRETILSVAWERHNAGRATVERAVLSDAVQSELSDAVLSELTEVVLSELTEYTGR